MSTRFYPRFVKGNPQLRIFLPDWKMIMIKTKYKLPENVVTFKVSPRMTDWDVKNYLEKIYKIQVASVKSMIRAGDIYPTPTGIAKKDDYKICHVSLPIGQKFSWPNLFPGDQEKEDEKNRELVRKEIVKEGPKGPNPPNVPGWFI